MINDTTSILGLFIDLDQISSTATFLCDPDLDFSCSRSLNIFTVFLCRLQSIATHRDHFVRRPSACLSVSLTVRLSHFSVILSKAMFRR